MHSGPNVRDVDTLSGFLVPENKMNLSQLCCALLRKPAKHLEAYFRAEGVTAARAPGPAAEGDVAVAPEADGSGRLQRRPDHARGAGQDAVAGFQGARRHQVPPPLLRLGDLVRLAVALVPLPVLPLCRS